MEETSDRLSDEEVENRIPEHMSNFRRTADRLGMHQQVVDASESFIYEAYRLGLEGASQ